MEVTYIPTDEIKPYKNNNKTHADNVDAIANSIECFGFQVPIVVSKNYVVITGHGRLLAAKKLKIDKIPCIISDLDQEREDEFRIIDNVTQSLGKLDFASVAREIMNNRVQSKYLNEMKAIITDIRNIKPLDPKILARRGILQKGLKGEGLDEENFEDAHEAGDAVAAAGRAADDYSIEGLEE